MHLCFTATQDKIVFSHVVATRKVTEINSILKNKATDYLF